MYRKKYYQKLLWVKWVKQNEISVMNNMSVIWSVIIYSIIKYMLPHSIKFQTPDWRDSVTNVLPPFPPNMAMPELFIGKRPIVSHSWWLKRFSWGSHNCGISALCELPFLLPSPLTGQFTVKILSAAILLKHNMCTVQLVGGWYSGLIITDRFEGIVQHLDPFRACKVLTYDQLSAETGLLMYCVSL